MEIQNETVGNNSNVRFQMQEKSYEKKRKCKKSKMWRNKHGMKLFKAKKTRGTYLRRSSSIKERQKGRYKEAEQ